MTMILREVREDIPAVRDVDERAFGQPAKADLVEWLRKSCPDLLSLVGCGKRPHRGPHTLLSCQNRWQRDDDRWHGL
ncbi:MAG: hypothetical protein LUO89_07345, partial [Methanothrix sp.]|nr:hypothetical protein [Methanothrix sp.]